MRALGRAGVQGLLACMLWAGLASAGAAAPDPLGATVAALFTNAVDRLAVSGYHVKGDPLLTVPGFTGDLNRHTGTNQTLTDVVRAAADLQLRYHRAGYTNVTIALGWNQTTNGIVNFTAFRGVRPQIVVDGRCCWPTNQDAATLSGLITAAGTNAAPAKPANTNPPAAFVVKGYDVEGDTVLRSNVIQRVLSKYTGTNITVANILEGRSALLMEYRNRGYVTVNVLVPPQTIGTNGIVKLRVFEGRLAEINVLRNRYFSSNNVMRALPGLRTNLLLVDAVFQAELDRANANQDRQIYPQVEAGPTEGTTVLDLTIKDRLPLHAKADFNNQNTPGTPDLRLNTSIMYNNLWQREHSLGLQYGFSPTDYKSGRQWDFQDQPLVANYGGFYRLPLGDPGPLGDIVVQDPGSFGYDEATRKFRLPAPSGQPEMNFFASRSTVDTGIMTLYSAQLYNTNGNTLDRQDVQQDLTVNNDLGFRLSVPLPATGKFQSSLSAGVDYKEYDNTSAKTNIFTLTSLVIDNLSGSTIPRTNINISHNYSPVPTTHRSVDYLPLSFRYNGSLRDPLGVTSFGLGLSVNTWYSGSLSNLQQITGSRESAGYWLTLTPSASRELLIRTNWVLSLNASAQWSDQPILSNEQFGVGGIGSVRGYHEGEVFGSRGWWATAEQKTPPYLVGRVYGSSLLSVRGSVYLGYGQTYNVGPNQPQDLCGVGFGGAASIGANWEARFLCSWPLISTGTTEAGHPRLDFGLSAQF